MDEELNKEEKIEDEKKPKHVKEEKHEKKSKKLIFVIIAIILAIIAIVSTVFAITVATNNKIAKGISIKGIDVSGLSKEEATTKLNEIILQNSEKEIILKNENYETTMSSKQLEINFNVNKSVEQAHNIGRNGNIIKNNYDVLSAILFKKEIPLELEYNKEELSKQIDDINSKIPNKLTQTSYYIEENNLIITKGTKGNIIKKEELIGKIEERINIFSNINDAIIIPVEEKDPDAIDIEKIHTEIFKQATDAYYTKDPFEIYPHVNGVDFSITIEEAKNMILEEKTEYIIPLKITIPNITTDEIGTEAFPDLLGTFSTKYDASNKSRTTNLSLASGKINGTVIMPGETFSYNKVVGERTIAAGYKEAKVYSNGRVVDGLGGGICQISSTLYNTIVFANLEIVSRRNHQFTTSYVPAGRDATVVYGSTDFVFKNTRKYPVKIKSSVANGIAKIDLYGIKEDVEYEIKIQPSTLEVIEPKTIYEEDPTLDIGKEKVIQNAGKGYKTVTYKVYYLDGKVVKKEILSKDTYNPMNKIVKKGTKGAVVTTVPETTVPETPVTTPTEPETPEINEQTPTETPTQPEELVDPVE